MSYDSKVDGALWLEPFPEPHEAAALREALAAFTSPGAGRLVLTPLGHGLVFEDTLDWMEAVEMIERARVSLFGPRGITVGGTLRAIGEDGAHLATVSLGAEGMRVEEHEAEAAYDDDDDNEGEDDPDAEPEE